MKRLITFLLLFAAFKVAGQTTGYLRFDTVMIYKQGGTAELVLMSKTKDTIGILTNYGNGRTRFMKSRAINDSTIVVGLDTLVIRGASGSGFVPRISSTDQEIVRFNGTNGDIQGTPGVTANGSGNFTVPSFWSITNATGLQYTMLPLSHGYSTPTTSSNNTPFDYVTGAQTQSSGSLELFRIATLYNQTSTAAGTDFVIRRTETALGSGTHNFFGLYGGAAGTTERFSIDRLGRVKVGKLDIGTVSDSVVVWDAATKYLKLVAQSDISGGDKLDSIHIYTATDPDPDSIYAYKNADSTLVGYVPKDGIRQLTGDVSAGPGSGSQVATITTNAVTTDKIASGAVTTPKVLDNNITYAKVQQVTAARLLGNPSGVAANVSEIPIGFGLLFNSSTLKADTSGANGLVTRSELKDSTDKVTQVMPPIVVLPGANSNISDTIALVTDATLDTTGGILSVNPAILPSINPGVYFSPGQNANPAFMVKALAIVAPTNSHSHGVSITWAMLNSTSDHNTSFFDSVYGNTSNGRLELRYPNVRQVLYGAAAPDEINSQYTGSAGPSVGLTTLQFPVFRAMAVGFRLTGNGAGTWTVNAGFPSLISASTHNTTTGVTGFNLTSSWGIDYNVVNMQYYGTSGYKIERQGAFSSYNVGFKLTDVAGNPVTINPASSDEVIITNAGMHPISVSMATWLNNTNEFMSTAANWFVDAWFECWMVAAPTSTTAIQVRWQTDYPSATNYKIYRSSTGLYGTFTLIHTGTSGVYADAGLTANTRYTYKMVAVVGGIDTDVTTWTTNTKF